MISDINLQRSWVKARDKANLMRRAETLEYKKEMIQKLFQQTKTTKIDELIALYTTQEISKTQLCESVKKRTEESTVIPIHFIYT